MLPLGTGCWHLVLLHCVGTDLCERFAALLSEGFQVALLVKNPPAEAGVPRDRAGMGGSILGCGRSSEEGIATQLPPVPQYSCLENPRGTEEPGGYSPTVVHCRTGLKHTLRLEKGICRERDSLMISFIMYSVPSGLTVTYVTKYQVGSHF